MSDSLSPHGLQCATLLCPPLSPQICANSCPLSWWCCLSIQSSASPFSFRLQSFPASGSFQMSWLFASGGQSIRALVSATVLSMNNQGWFPLGLILDWFYLLAVQDLSGVFSNTTVSKHQFFSTQPSLWSNSLHMTTGKTIDLTQWTFVSKVISLLFNTVSRCVIHFLPKSKHLLSSLLQSPSSVLLEFKKIKSVTASTFSPSLCHQVMGPDAMILGF